MWHLIFENKTKSLKKQNVTTKYQIVVWVRIVPQPKEIVCEKCNIFYFFLIYQVKLNFEHTRSGIINFSKIFSECSEFKMGRIGKSHSELDHFEVWWASVEDVFVEKRIKNKISDILDIR